MNLTRLLITHSLIVTLIVSPYAQAKTNSSAELQTATHNMYKELARFQILNSDKPLQEPSAWLAREVALNDDIYNILNEPTEVIINQDSMDMNYNPRLSITTTDRFVRVAQRVALERALDTFFTFGTIVADKSMIASLLKHPGLKSMPKIKVMFETLSQAQKLSREERDLLVSTAIEAIIWKGIEIGAMVEQSEKMKTRLLEIEELLPDADNAQRNFMGIEKRELQEKVHALEVLIDSHLYQEVIYSVLTQPMQLNGVFVPLFVYIHAFAVDQVEKYTYVNINSPEFAQLKNKLTAAMYRWPTEILNDSVAFVNSLFAGSTAALAPLAGVRWEALERIRSTLSNDSRFVEYVKENASLELRYGFDQGKYNGYTSQDFVNSMIATFVGAEMIKVAAKVPTFRNARASILKNTRAIGAGLKEGAVKRGFLMRVAGTWGGHAVVTFGRFANPIVAVGSLIPLGYSGLQWMHRSNYRAFLKTFLPQAYRAGVVGYKLAEFSQEVDDSIVDILFVSEALGSIFFGHHISGLRWLMEGRRVAQWGAAAISTAGVWMRWALAYRVSFTKAVEALFKSSAVRTVLSPTLLAQRAVGLLAQSYSRYGRPLSFTAGSLAMLIDIHFAHEGYGHINKWLPRAWNSEEGFWKTLGEQFSTLWNDSPQFRADFASIALSEMILGLGTLGHETKDNNKLGHLYGWVSAVSDIVGQAVVADVPDRTEGLSLEELQDRYGAISWERGVLHYAFIRSFSMAKHIWVYVPLLKRVVTPAVNKIVNIEFMMTKQARTRLATLGGNGVEAATLIKASGMSLYNRALFQTNAVMRGVVMELSTFGLSLASNWVGNKGFVDIARILASNKTNVPQDLIPTLVESAETTFKKHGLVYNIEAANEATAELKRWNDQVEAARVAINLETAQ